MDLETLLSNPKEAQILLAKYPMLLELLNMELQKKSNEAAADNQETVKKSDKIADDVVDDENIEGTNIVRQKIVPIYESTIPLVVSELLTAEQSKPTPSAKRDEQVLVAPPPLLLPPVVQPTDEKYLQFQKWLNDSVPTPLSPPTLTTIDYVDDENEIFLDSNDIFPTAATQSRRSSASDWTADSSEPTGRRYRPNKGKAPPPPTDEPRLSVAGLLLTVDAGGHSCRSSNSDLTIDSSFSGARKRSHKGPAPLPPATTDINSTTIDNTLETIFTKCIPQMLTKPAPASTRNVHMETDI